MTKGGSTATKHVSEKPAKKGTMRLHDMIMGGSEASSKKAHPQLRTRQEDL
jgi:hypothetical protein